MLKEGWTMSDEKPILPYPFALVFFSGKREAQALPEGIQYIESDGQKEAGCLMVSPANSAFEAIELARPFIVIGRSVAGPFRNQEEWITYGKAIEAGTGGATPLAEILHGGDIEVMVLDIQAVGAPKLFFLVGVVGLEGELEEVVGVQRLVASQGVGVLLIEAEDESEATAKAQSALDNRGTCLPMKGPFQSLEETRAALQKWFRLV
jgi:hypothetical protein